MFADLKKVFKDILGFEDHRLLHNDCLSGDSCYCNAGDNAHNEMVYCYLIYIMSINANLEPLIAAGAIACS